MARICREYGMTYWDVLKLPLKTFWSFNRQVDRLRAEGEQRQLRLQSVAQSPEGSGKLNDQLTAEMGAPLRIEKKFDAGRFDELRDKFKDL